MFQQLIERAATTGVTGALPYDPVEYCIIAAGTAIAWAYTVELDLVILYTFRRRKGLYFWALLISSWGCSLHALGFILKFLVGTSWLIELPFVEIGKSYRLPYLIESTGSRHQLQDGYGWLQAKPSYSTPASISSSVINAPSITSSG